MSRRASSFVAHQPFHFLMIFSSHTLRILPLVGLIAASCSTPSTNSSVTASPVTLTKAVTPKNLSIKTACALAVNHHPSLATYPMDRRAADARILQATRIPNPELTVDAEDFFGTGGVSGLGSSILNALFTQVIERGGKREARTEAARSEGRAMDAEYEIRRRKVIQETGELYIETVAARENVRFLEASLKRSNDTANLVSQLSEAGRVTISSVQQAKLEVQKTELKLSRARKASERVSQALTAQWGDSRSSQPTDQRLDAPPAHLDSKSSQKQGLTRHPKFDTPRPGSGSPRLFSSWPRQTNSATSASQEDSAATMVRTRSPASSVFPCLFQSSIKERMPPLK